MPAGQYLEVVGRADGLRRKGNVLAHGCAEGIQISAGSDSVVPIEFALGIAVARKLRFRQVRPEIRVALFSLPLLAPWIVVGFLWRHMMSGEAGLIGTPLSALALAPDLNGVVWSWITIVAMDVWHWTGLVVILCYAGYLAISTTTGYAVHHLRYGEGLVVVIRWP